MLPNPSMCIITQILQWIFNPVIKVSPLRHSCLYTLRSMACNTHFGIASKAHHNETLGSLGCESVVGLPFILAALVMLPVMPWKASRWCLQAGIPTPSKRFSETHHVLTFNP